MSRSYAILIDAGFLKRKRGSQKAPMTATHVEAFIDQIGRHPRLCDLILHRIYYYDAPPLEISVDKPLGGGKEHFATSSLARANKALQSLAIAILSRP
jgi:hypothetical protein